MCWLMDIVGSSKQIILVIGRFGINEIISMHHRQSQWGDYLGIPPFSRVAHGVKVQVGASITC